MRRDLLSVRSGKVLGTVSVDNQINDRSMTGWAPVVLEPLRRRYKTDARIVDAVMAQGWANQSLYFGEVIDDAPGVRTA